jgi:hypothetical protein
MSVFDDFGLPKYDPNNWFWIIDGDEQRGYSSAACSYVPIANVDMTRVARVSRENDMIAVLRSANVPPYHRVSKSTVLARLGDENCAKAFGLATVGQQLRWNAPDKPQVNADDTETIALIRSVGADPKVVLAPE